MIQPLNTKDASSHDAVSSANDSTLTSARLRGSPNTIVVVGVAALWPRFERKLRAAGFTLIAARSATEAQQFVKDRVPVAMLLAAAPGPDPYVVVRFLRCQERLAFVQIIVFPVRGESLKLSQALRAGADDILDCPLERLDEAIDCIAARIDRSQTLAQLAALDPLTGLRNRRLMNDQMTAEIARAGRMGTNLSIAIVDLDHFKRINDEFGHAIGDRTLTAFARTFGRSLRDYDLPLRWR
jgi:PleD family two-component response regulator